MEKVICSSCGAKMDESFAFCAICGNKRLDNHHVESSITGNEKAARDALSNPKISEPAGQNSDTNPVTEKGANSRIGSFFVCLLLFICCMTSFFIFIVRDSTTQQAFTSIVDKVNLGGIYVGLFLSESDSDYDKNTTLTEYICILLNENEGVYLKNVNDGKIEKLLENNSLKTFIAEKLTDYFSDIFTDNGAGYISNHEFVSLIKKMSSSVNKIMDYKLDDYDYELISDWLVENSFFELSNLRQISRDMGVNLTFVRWFFSYYIFVLLLLLAISMVFLLFKLNKLVKARALKYAGAVFLCIGILYSVLGLAAHIIIDAVFNIPLNPSMIRALLSVTQRDSLVVGIVTFFIGILLVIVSYVLTKSLHIGKQVSVNKNFN